MNAQFIATIIFAVVTCTAVFVGIFLTDIVKQRLPSHTRLALEQFAKMAVLKVEQTNPELSDTAKKQLAIVAVSTLLHSFHLPPIDQEVIGIAIDAEMYLRPKTIVASVDPPSLPETTKANE
jgi:Bacteriophage holin of superfamily 6 (Holin_LLH)